MPSPDDPSTGTHDQPSDEELLAAADAENARLKAIIEAQRGQMGDTVKAIEEDWTTWSDPELMGRLLRRECEAVHAKALVRDRVMPDAVEEIEEFLKFTIVNDHDEVIKLETTLDRRARR